VVVTTINAETGESKKPSDELMRAITPADLRINALGGCTWFQTKSFSIAFGPFRFKEEQATLAHLKLLLASHLRTKWHAATACCATPQQLAVQSRVRMQLKDTPWCLSGFFFFFKTSCGFKDTNQATGSERCQSFHPPRCLG